jgi:hypothetical protein
MATTNSSAPNHNERVAELRIRRTRTRNADPAPRAQRVLSAGLLALAFATLAPAQTVRVANTGMLPWFGWKRVTVDRPMTATSGWLPGGLTIGGVPVLAHDAEFRVGRAVGLETTVVDVKTALLPGEHRTFDLATFTGALPAPPMPADIAAYFGAFPAANGTPLACVSLQHDGSGWSGHFRARIAGDPMLVCDLWITWYPDQPWCHGECVVNASNSAVPDMVAWTPAGVTLTFGDAIIAVLGRSPWDGLVVPAGTSFGDGQARAVPVTFLWLQHAHADPNGQIDLLGLLQLLSFAADSHYSIGGVGLDHLLVDGNPRLPAGFNASAWAQSTLPDTLSRMHDWRAQTTGPNPHSGDTGAQTGDQTFVGEVLNDPMAAGSELIRYLGALKQWARPSNHREPDGRPLDPALHVNPRLVLWDGRAHPSAVVSPDRLGKPRELDYAAGESNGWWGPDVEHFFFNTLAGAARVTGSPACQALLANQARIYLLQQTTMPAVSTSQPFASRAIGWEGVAAVHLWRELEDRVLADQVRAHWIDRWNVILQPALVGVTWWPDGYGPTVVSPWQQAVGAYGVDLAGRVFGVPAACSLALLAARAVVDHDCYLGPGSLWACYSTLQLPSNSPQLNATNIFWLFGTPMAAWLTQSEVRGGAIWTQMLGDASHTYQTAWLPPGVH